MEDGPIPLEVKNGKVTKWVCRCGKSRKLPECDWTCAKKKTPYG